MSKPALSIDDLTPEQLQKLQARMAALRAGAQAQAQAPAVEAIPRRAGSGPAPLSFAQQQIWLQHQLDPEGNLFNVPTVLRLRGELDRDALRRALDELVRRHELLRTVFELRDDGPVQVVAPARGAPLLEAELSGEPDPEAAALARADAEAARPFDLAAEPPFRALLLRVGPRDHVLGLFMHHIARDRWASGVLLGEMAALYRAFREGAPSPLPEPRIQFADYAAWERERMGGEALERLLAFWKGHLAGAPPPQSPPADHPRGSRPMELVRLPVRVPPDTGDALRRLARAESGTAYMVLLAAYLVLLRGWTGEDDLVVGTYVAGRTRPETERLVGSLANTLALRFRVEEGSSFRDLLRQVRGVVLEAQRHAELPFERLVEELQPAREPGRTPLVRSVVNVSRAAPADLALPGLEAETLPFVAGGAGVDVQWALEEWEEGIVGQLEYDAGLYLPATAERLVAAWLRLLAAAVAAPDEPLDALPLLAPGEREQVLRAWNATEADYPVEGGLAGLWEAQAARTPDAEALVFGRERLSYAELDRRAAALAARLRSLGAGTDARVGLCVERSLEMVVGVLGILKAGAAYVPIDPAYPEDRVAYMLEDAGISVLLTQERVAAGLPEFGGQVVLLDTPHPPAPSPTRGEGEHGNAEDGQAVAGCSLFPVPCSLSLAYVIYTSGSTGRPKGVAMQQRPLLNLVAWQLRDWREPGPAVTLQFATISFDASFHEMFSCWAQGGTLVVAPEEARRDPAAVLELLEREGVERLFLPFVALQHLAEEALERGAFPRRLREVQTAGEQLRVTDAIRAWLGGLGIPLHNHYGPSETHVATALALDGDPAGWPLLPSIGGPVANTRCYVLDAGLRPTPVGVPGELYLAGDCVARGYLGRPGLTAERFLPDAFGGEPGARMYRSGDRARWTAAGELEFLGRVDQQVKVRGFRIEPGEVEAALEAHPAVREAVVVARDGGPGGRRLVGYVVAEEGAEAPAAAELRAWVGARLPEYMVPAALVALEGLPLTPSGKTDRRALPEPGPSAEDGPGYAAPETPTEEILAGIFAAVLGVEAVGAHDDFFALGGHSLLASRVVARARKPLGVELPLRDVVEAPTVRALAARADALLRAGAADGAPPLVPVPRGGPLPASFAQRRLWFIDRLEPGSAAYNLPAALRLRGRLDVPALRRTLAEVVRRHEALRTVFAEDAGEPVQVVRAPGPVALPVADLGRLAPAAREAEAARLARAEALRPFDLAAGPLLRAGLLRLGPDDWALLVGMHHTVSDGWSLGILVREVAALYAAFAGGAASPLPELPVQYADFAAWQRARLAGPVLDAQVGWWRDSLAGAPPLLEVPTDRPRPAVQGGAGESAPFAVPAEVVAGLRALARGEGATLFMALLAGWQLLLARWSGQDDVVVGTPVAGRTRVETEGLIGFFVNTLALRARTDADAPFRALLARTRETTLGAYQHQEVPFERLVEELAPERSLGHTPLFQAMFALRDPAQDDPRLGDLAVEPLAAGDPPAKFDLHLELGEEAGEVRGALVFRAELWDRATTGRMLGHLGTLLAGIAADPERAAGDLPLLDAAERTRVLEEWNATARPYPAGLRVHDLFAAQARRTPDAAALSHRGETVTYGELDRRSARLANALCRRGVGPEVRVGICLGRTPALATAMLGVLRAGGAWVPLDPAHPRERLAGVLGDAGARLVITESALADRLPAGAAALLRIDAEREALEAESAAAPESGVTAENLSHVIFTSGSTGRPKGVMIRHSSTVVLLHWMREAMADEERASVLWSTSVGFDVSVAEVFGTLAWGGRLVLVENALELASAGEPVATASMVPTAAAELLRTGGIPACVRTLNLGGEALPAQLARELYALGTVRTVRNLYGPTEDTTYSTCAVVERGAAAVPVGRPLAGTRAYVLDARLQPAPAGAAGELYLAGDGLARGYVGRPELTAERFLPAPFGAPGERMYRTGDRARWLPAGELEYLGRIDQQVKLRGFRVEPGEVEAVLRRHPAVREAVAVVRDDAPGGARLVAYVVPAAGAAPDAAELRAWAAGRLPESMVPSAWVALDALPLTATGKTDRRALPPPERTADADAYVPPRTPTEELLAAIWAEVLGAERVGAADDFFALGGHSLLATRVVARIRDALGVELPLRALFEAPTVAALAARVDVPRTESAADEPALVPAARTGRRRTPSGGAIPK
jgi:amino acid adenylation domain-containing protein